MGESGGSAERMAAELRARGSRAAGAWAAGAEGERRVGAELAALPPSWLVLHDRLLLPGLAESNLDHLLVGPAGVILIDAKNWAGQIGEWEGLVFQHSWRPDGQRLHRPVDREFAGVHTMAREVARRINHGVTVVICLAGRQADHFGEPRVVKDVWVVPVGRLVEWLASRPCVAAEPLERLGVLVRTEFPSTTTDAALLQAMGRDLARRLPTPAERVRLSAPNRAGSAHGVPAAASGALRHPGTSRPPTRPARRRGRARPLVGLLGVIALLVALHTGALTTVTAAVGAAVSDVLTDLLVPGAGSRIVGPGGPLTTAGATMAPVRLSCASLDPSRFTQLSGVTLKGTERPGGCGWSLPPEKASELRRLVLQLGEDTESFGLQQAFARSAKSGAPEVQLGYGYGVPVTRAWVAKGVKVKVGKTQATANRYVHMTVAHEALGLTAKQGRALAVAMAGAASAIPLTASGVAPSP